MHLRTRSSEVVRWILYERSRRTSEEVRQLGRADFVHQRERHRGIRKWTVDGVSQPPESMGVCASRNPVDGGDAGFRLRFHDRDGRRKIPAVRGHDLFHRDAIARAGAEISERVALSWPDSVLVQVFVRLREGPGTR